MTLVQKLRAQIARKDTKINQLEGCLNSIWEHEVARREMEDRSERRRAEDHEREMALRSLGWW